MKRLYMFRHGKKDEPEYEPRPEIKSPSCHQLILQDELDRITRVFRKFGPQMGPIDYLSHTTVIRTSMCVTAAILGLSKQLDTARYLEPVRNLIPLASFDEIFPAEFRALAKQGVPTVKAFHQYWQGLQDKGLLYKGAKGLEYWMTIASLEVTEILKRMSDGKIGLNFNHSPVIETAALHLDPKNATQDSLEPLEGILFTMQGDTITTERINPNLP